MIRYYCLCCACFQGPPKALGSCSVWCCRNTQEGDRRTKSLLHSRVLSAEGRLFLQTSPSSCMKCEAYIGALLRALSHSWAAVSCICKAMLPSLSCIWPPHGQENWANLIGVTVRETAWYGGSWDEVVRLSCSQRWDSHSKALCTMASPFII